MLHINSHTLLVHPTLAIVRVTCEIRWEFLPGRCRLVIPLVRPKLITIRYFRCQKKHYDLEGGEHVPAAVVKALTPLVHRNRGRADQILVVESHACGHEEPLTARTRVRRTAHGDWRRGIREGKGVSGPAHGERRRGNRVSVEAL